MSLTRVIPILLLKERGVVKTRGFRSSKYVGDPINTIKIFNEKAVDEIIILDIEATKQARGPDFFYLQSLASQCFMPMAYGGGIRTLSDIEKVLQAGVEKVILNTQVFNDLMLIERAAYRFGSQSIIVSIDFKKNWIGKYGVVTHCGKKYHKLPPVQYAKAVELYGAGEVFLNSIDRDGMRNGYDLELIQHVSSQINIPLIACGGAASKGDFVAAIQHGASAVAAGSLFVFHGRHDAVLISYLDESELGLVQQKQTVSMVEY